MRIDTFFDIKNILSGSMPHLVVDPDRNRRGVKANFKFQPFILICNITGPAINNEEVLTSGKTEPDLLQVGVDEYIRPDFPFYLFNHSCEPNCGINKDLQLVTIKAVQKDEELCWDYSTSMLGRNDKPGCTCGKSLCRRSITDFDLLPEEVQNEYYNLKIVSPYITEHIHTPNKLLHA